MIILPILGSLFGLFQLTPAEHLPPAIFYRLLINSFKFEKLQEEKCVDNQCYQVYESLVYRDYRPIVSRALGFKYPSPYAHSVYELHFPTDFSIENLNTSNWKVNKSILRDNTFCLTISEAPFWSGVIPRNSSEIHNIMLIGMAGAMFNNYWAATYPHLNITAVEINPVLVELGNRWFTVQQNNKHRVFTEDGAVFVTSAAKRGEHYEALVLDATYDDVEREVTAPVDVFQKPDVLHSISHILKPSGVLIVNVVIGEKTDSRLGSLNKIVQEFKEVFEFVEVFHSGDFNAIVMCRQVSIDAIQLKDLPEEHPYIKFQQNSS